MAFGKGEVRTEESAEIKRYIGITPVNVLAINPNKKELESIYGRELDKEPEYISEVEVDGKKIPQIRIDFIVKAVPTKANDKQPINLINKVSIFLRKSYKKGSKSGKYQIIDKYGRTAWATEEEIKAKAIPQYTSGPANIDIDYRPAIVGEEELTSFVRTFLGVKSVEKWVDGKVVGLIDNPQDAEARLDKINDYFKGDLKELKEIMGYQPNNKIKVLFGIRNMDNGVIHQTVYNRSFLSVGSKNYSKLDKEIKEAQNNGGLQNTEYKCVDLQEYSVIPTDFSEAPSSDLPFGEPTEDIKAPWE